MIGFGSLAAMQHDWVGLLAAVQQKWVALLAAVQHRCASVLWLAAMLGSWHQAHTGAHWCIAGTVSL
jgi:hypothetical protein